MASTPLWRQGWRDSGSWLDRGQRAALSVRLADAT
jgi:hypothetical protein